MKDWDIKINYGIKTGFNEAFIINGVKRQELLEKCPEADGIIRPILRGRDIQKYSNEYANLWLIYIPWHFPFHNDSTIKGVSFEAEKEFEILYPAIYEHLLNYKIELSQRNKSETGVRYEWYALQRFGSNYMEDFSKQKIVWKRIGSVLRFSYDNSGAFCLDSTCFATGQDIKFLVGYLNSTLSKRMLLDNSPKTGTGDIITSVQALEPLLIPKVDEEQKLRITNLVDKSIELLNNNINADLSIIESEIDEIIYQSYELSEEEIQYIKNSFFI